MRREGKIKKLISLLTQDFYTVDELTQLTGVSKNTVRIQLSFHLPKKGYKILKSTKNGADAYKIEVSNTNE